MIVGDGACGKTSLLSVFSLGEFPSEYEPTIFEVSSLFHFGNTLSISASHEGYHYRPTYWMGWDGSEKEGGAFEERAKKDRRFRAKTDTRVGSNIIREQLTDSSSFEFRIMWQRLDWTGNQFN